MGVQTHFGPKFSFKIYLDIKFALQPLIRIFISPFAVFCRRSQSKAQGTLSGAGKFLVSNLMYIFVVIVFKMRTFLFWGGRSTVSGFIVV